MKALEFLQPPRLAPIETEPKFKKILIEFRKKFAGERSLPSKLQIID